MADSLKLIDPENYGSITCAKLQDEIEILESLYLYYELSYIRPLRAIAESVAEGTSVCMSERSLVGYQKGLRGFLELRRRLRLASTEMLRRLDSIIG